MTQSDSGETRIEGERLVIERVVEAPRELVWSAWTEPEQFTRWYGPAGMSLDVCEIDFRVGGSHLFGMRMPDGGAYFTSAVNSFRPRLRPSSPSNSRSWPTASRDSRWSKLAGPTRVWPQVQPSAGTRPSTSWPTRSRVLEAPHRGNPTANRRAEHETAVRQS